MNGDLNSWDKFCNYLWFDKKLNIWLDISKINFTSKEIKNLEEKFKPLEHFCSDSVISNGPNPLPPIPIHRTSVYF